MNSSKKIEVLIDKYQSVDKLEDFDFLANSLPNIVWLTDIEGNLEYCNALGYEFTGLSPENVFGWEWSQVIHPEDLERTLNIWSDCLNTTAPYEVEYRMRRKDGEYKWQLARALPLKDNRGAITKWFGTCTDIHDFKLAQEAAKLAKDQLQAVINNAPIILWAVDSNGIFTMAEGKGLEDLENTDDIIGKSQFDLHIGKYPDLVKNVKKALKGKEITDENEFARRIYQTTFAPLENLEGKIVGMVAVSLDITERKKSEKDKVKKREFLNNVSNEIQASVNAILGFSNVLKKENLPAEQKEEYINDIHNSAEQLLSLIGQMVDLSKLEEGKLTLLNESFDLVSLMNSSINPIIDSAKEKGLGFELIIDDKIPNKLLGDAGRITQVVHNLLKNAIKLSREGSIKMVVSNLYPDSEIPEALIKFSITYTGTAANLEKNKLDAIDFRDLKNHRETELGLSMIEQIIQLMGGELSISTPMGHKAREKQRTTFSFSLNLNIDNSIPGASFSASVHSELPKGIKVLVVEDVKTNQKLAEVVFTALGCDVEFANNGEEAIIILDKRNFDIIFMDNQMPVMNGFDTTRVIRNLFDKKVPIVGLCEGDLQEELRNSIEAGMNEQISKPFSEKQVLEIIRKLVFKEASE